MLQLCVELQPQRYSGPWEVAAQVHWHKNKILQMFGFTTLPALKFIKVTFEILLYRRERTGLKYAIPGQRKIRRDKRKPEKFTGAQGELLTIQGHGTEIHEFENERSNYLIRRSSIETSSSGHSSNRSTYTLQLAFKRVSQRYPGCLRISAHWTKPKQQWTRGIAGQAQ